MSDMGSPLQKILTSFVELIRVCVRELKACTTGLDVSFRDLEVSLQPLLEEETVSTCAGLVKTGLEKFLAGYIRSSHLHLPGRKGFLTDRQQRVCDDLEVLRSLLSTAEELDGCTLQAAALRLVNDREVRGFSEKNATVR